MAPLEYSLVPVAPAGNELLPHDNEHTPDWCCVG